MRTFNAIARREDDWWVVEVEGVATTQGRTEAEAEHMVADVVAAMLELDPAEFEVKVEFRRGEVDSMRRRVAKAAARVMDVSRTLLDRLKGQ